MPQYAAILQRHGGDFHNDSHYTGGDGVMCDHKIVLVPVGQSLKFDDDAATRKWLWPYLGTEWHLVGFLEVEEVSAAALADEFHQGAKALVKSVDNAPLPVKPENVK